MIKVKDLNKWIEDHTVGRSRSYPQGWISPEDLMKLAKEVSEQHPLAWNPKKETTIIVEK